MSDQEEPIVIRCLTCDLPLVRNHHPDAGKPEFINVVGCQTGCLPCAEKRANGRQKMIAELYTWIESEAFALKELSMQHGGVRNLDSKIDELHRVLNKIKALEEQRRVAYRAT